MGRPSAASLSSVATTGTTLAQRPKPWPGLTEREVELWKFVVNSQPVDWFSPADQPLLMAYVRSISLHEAVSIAAFGQPHVIRGAQGSEIANPIFKVQNSAAGTMAALATKLRLTQSSRIHAEKAGTKARKHAQNSDAGKPWEKVA